MRSFCARTSALGATELYHSSYQEVQYGTKQSSSRLRIRTTNQKPSFCECICWTWSTILYSTVGSVYLYGTKILNGSLFQVISRSLTKLQVQVQVHPAPVHSTPSNYRSLVTYRWSMASSVISFDFVLYEYTVVMKQLFRLPNGKNRYGRNSTTGLLLFPVSTCVVRVLYSITVQVVLYSSVSSSECRCRLHTNQEVQYRYRMRYCTYCMYDVRYGYIADTYVALLFHRYQYLYK